MISALRLARIPTRSLNNAAQQRAFSLASLQQKSFSALVQEIRANNKNIHHISPKDLHAISSTASPQNPRLPPHIIDVREPHEVEATGTIPGAVFLPRGILERDIGKFLKQNDPRDVVVYCAGGFRSVLAAESLVRLGYGVVEGEMNDSEGAKGLNPQESKDKPRVWSLDEGMDGWIKSGFEVEKKAKN
ncbi:Rhodanese-like domain-containing protein [Gamsiella multidivaricata]|uniref:Rhodanese-like domain-containing protein n=1 Tax=Gamsiella multidivaricata TaxID=101098 RepID=UPI00221EF4F4|nr:Rhodanese-like domain-containing protein [Gamsiella multidivaricata]KAG0366236.1 hypothetical protein BGZ54_005634 [Gamsiella multidivaricata]KAI7819246.1 Rhodanese-like domain-containing protein [Gamsiella multidivaricata]